MIAIEEIKIKVKGVVQGVGFRYYVKSESEKLGLRGRAKNLIDGSVEIIAQGERDQLETLIENVNNGGPLSAEVSDIEVSWSRPEAKIKDFNIE